MTLGEILYLMLSSFFGVLLLTILLASFGKSLGIRKLYVRTLLQIFEISWKITSDYNNNRRKNDKGSKGLFTLTDDFETSSSENEEKDEDSFLTNNQIKKDRLLNCSRFTRHNVISRKDHLVLNPEISEKIKVRQTLSVNSFQREFELEDVLDYVKTGIASVIEDEVTIRFVAEELKNWNLLTRTSCSFQFINLKLTIIWILGFFVRYCILFPGRLCILFVGLLWMGICMALLGLLPEGRLKRWLHYHVFTSCFQILGGALSAVITYHNCKDKPGRGIVVANHTSPIDVLILACDNAYALIGQGHSGFIGLMQRILTRASSHIWFERGETKDRLIVIKRLKEHVENPNKLPILIFPEGTCINNTSVMQFKKGSFEVGGTIYPVAIKYDPKFGDAFWNSSNNGMLSYIFMMMTSWAIVCDVWYLPPMTMKPEEDSIHFANRVKSLIARQGGLVDLMWDGNLKRSHVKTEWKEKQQEDFSRRLKV